MIKDKNKTKDQLIQELLELRQRVAELEKSEAAHKGAEETPVKKKPDLSDREQDERNRETNLFCQMGSRLQTCENLDEAYGVIQRFGADLFPTVTGALFISAGLQKTMEAVAAWGGDMQSERLFPPADCQALHQGQAWVVKSSAEGNRCKHISPSFSGAYLDVPVTASGEVMGLLHLESRKKPYDRKTEDLALIVAEHLALSLSNLKLREAISEESIRDPLTGLFNRRYMEESLAQELSRAARGKYPVSLVVLSIDSFKSLNDTFGRDVGDRVLKELGSLIQSQVRRGDVSCRFGAETFVLVLPNARSEFAVQRARGLKETIENMNLVFQGNPLGTIAVSVGVAAYPDHGTSPVELLERAEQALKRTSPKRCGGIEETQEKAGKSR